MKKKIISLCLVVALVAIAVVGGTLAYFTDSDDATNTFTVGNVKIDLTEPNWDTEGSVDAKEAYPGEPLKKDPTVTNVGANPCFVRISVTGLDCLKNKGKSAYDITYRTDYIADKLGDNWVKGSDGYFYYTKVLQPEDVTDALFDQIVIPTDVENGNATAEFNVIVKAEAVQAQGAKPSFTAVEAMTVDEIAAWFTTCGL